MEKKDEVGKRKPPEKKTMYLRLGYKSEPRKRAKKKSSDCLCGKRNCKSCKKVNIISPEELLKGVSETTEPVCLEAVCEENCSECPSGNK